MLELRNRNELLWPERLRPRQDDQDNKEPLADWRARHEEELSHLHPFVVEQWIYRHFRETRFGFIDLAPLVWREETWSTADYLERVHLEFGGPLDPDWDYEQFQRGGGFGPVDTARLWADGTWNIPPVALETPGGVHSHDGERPDVRFLLIEGSKRYRYLNALQHRGEATGPHSVFIVASPAL